jgi:zinc protease
MAFFSRRCGGFAARAVALIATAFFLSAPLSAQAADWAPETFDLPNGMQVVVLPDHRMPTVTHMVWYRVGGADDPEGQSGIAHFLEHLMFKGTDKIPPGEFSKIIARNGGQDNAFTSYDYTAYFQRVARDRLPVVMEMEADRMQNVRFDLEQVLPERDVIKEERRSRVDNRPQSLLSEQMASLLFVRHPYGTPLIGWMEEISQLSREDALAFYDRHYGPDNAILIVAGDVTAEELRPLAEKYYGVIPSRGIPERVRPAEPRPIAARRVDLKDARVRQPSWSRQWIAPVYQSGKGSEAEALDVFVEVLGGGTTSVLYETLVVEKGVAASATAWYASTGLDYGRLAVSASPRPGVSLETLEAEIEAVLAKVLEEGVSDEAVATAKSRLVAEAVYARDSQSLMARIYGVGLTTGLTVDDVSAWPERIEAVTKDEMMAAALDLLVPERAVTGTLSPPETTASSSAPAAPSSPEYEG